MNLKKTKKAFTIVELVIVIAVIGVLAGVLVPSFSNVITKAQREKDNALITNLNKAVQLDCIDKQIEKHGTMSDAISACEDAGYIVDTIVLRTGYNIAWESTSGKFVAIDEENDLVNFRDGESGEYSTTSGGHKKIEYFLVRNDASLEPNGYSIYAGPDFIAENYEFNVGFDAGHHNDFEKLVYNNQEGTEQTVIIKTNGDTALEIYGFVDIDGTGDDIHHYGQSGKQIINCAESSFYEHGGSTYTILKRGHFVQEDGSIVAYLIANAEDGNVIIDLLSGCITGTVTNDNDKNDVIIRNEVGAFVVNVEVRNTNGKLTIDFKEAPSYANDYDHNSDSEKEYISGLGLPGQKGKNNSSIPFSNKPTSQGGCFNTKTGYYEHDWATVEGMDVKVCKKCGAFSYFNYKHEGVESADDNSETTINFNQYEDGNNENPRTPQEEKPVHIHAWGDWQTLSAPKCESEGVDVRYCACGAKQYQKHSKLNHDWGEDGKCKRQGCNAIKPQGELHSHDYKNIILDEPATCEGQGILIRQCECGDEIYEIRDALKHNYVNGKCTRCSIEQVCKCENKTETKIQDASCTRKGLKKYTCNTCGSITYEYIEMISHDTKGEAGSCSMCGYYICTHPSTSISTSRYADGVLKKVCSCGYVGFDVCNHKSFVTTKNGSPKEYKCNDCGMKWTDDSNSKKHIHAYGSFNDVTGCPSYSYKACDCGHTIISNLQTNHSFNDQNKCACGYVKQNPGHIHNFNNRLEKQCIPADCIHDGLEVYKCNSCDDIQYTILNKTGHKFEGEEKICIYCGAKQVHNHDYKAGTGLAQTCIHDGYSMKECSYCHDKLYTVIPADGTSHYYVLDVCQHCGDRKNKVHNCVFIKDNDLSCEATCLTDGILYEVCECGNVRAEITLATGHKFSNVKDTQLSKAATCTKDGYDAFKCTNPGCEDYEIMPIRALDHDWIGKWNSDNEYTHTIKCTRCTQTITMAHNIVVSNAGSSEISTCSICGYTSSKLYVCERKDESGKFNKYTTLTEALSVNGNNKSVVVRLLTDVTYQSDIVISGKSKNDFTLDLNGYSLYLANGKKIIVNQADFTISDSSDEADGSIVGNCPEAIICVYTGNTLTVRSGLIENKNEESGCVVKLEGSASLKQIGAHLKSNAKNKANEASCAIYTSSSDAKITIEDGIVECLNGYAAINSNGASLVLNGGKVYCFNYAFSGSKICVPENSSLIAKSHVIFNPNKAHYSICGGMYSTDVNYYLPVDGKYECVAKDNWFIVRVKQQTEQPESGEAIVLVKLNGEQVQVYSGSLAQAVRFANDYEGEYAQITVKLLKDATSSGIVVDKKMIIDLDGHTVTSNASSSDGFVFLIHHDEKNVNNSLGSTICNGTIEANKGYGVRVLNHGKDKHANTVTKNLSIVASQVNLKDNKKSGKVKIELSVGDFTNVKDNKDKDYELTITSGKYDFNPCKYLPGASTDHDYSKDLAKDGDRIVIGDYIVIRQAIGNSGKSRYIVRSY